MQRNHVKRSPFLLLAGSLSLGLVLSLVWLCGGRAQAARSSDSPSPDPNSIVASNVYLPSVLKNTTGQIVSVFVNGSQSDRLEMASLPFQEATGIDIQFVEFPSEGELVGEITNGNVPDMALLPQIGYIRQLADGGYTIDMNSWFTPTYLLGQYDQVWLDMLTYNNEMIGIWTNTNIKSIVWYPKAKFEAAGYQVPTTWTEMISLTKQITDDGTTPWCIGIGSGGATGWVGTDWVEDIMLRTTSTSYYDDWTLGNLLFSSAQVKNAFQTMGQIWLNDTYVYSGTAAIKNISFGEAPQPMFEDPPGCFLHRQATFITQFFPPEAELGVDVDYFVLPPIDPQYDTPLLVAGDMYAVMADRPEVRQYARFLTTAESVKYVIEQGGVLSPHKDVDLSWYPSDFERGYAQLLANASVVRYDGSDSMPGQVGTVSFWSGIVDFVDGVDLDTILANIDASWP